MKNKLLTFLVISSLLVAGCSRLGNDNGIGNDIESSEGDNYEGVLTVAGVGSEISMDPTVDEGTLVLIGRYEDHTDHIFLQNGTRESYFDSENEYLPGNIIEFKGNVEFIDGAAGNHYFDVKNIEVLKLKSFPEKEEINDLIDSYNFCETDDDCELIAGECPFGCWIALNKNFKDVAGSIMGNYFDNIQGPQCIYDCVYAEKAVCESYKCEVKLITKNE